MMRGGGDLASGVALRLFRAGIKLLITELPQPMAVRRLVSFAEAIYEGEVSVEGIQAIQAEDLEQAEQIIASGGVPVMVDPDASLQERLEPLVLIDARMTKQPPQMAIGLEPLVIGLGPGFVAGENCHAAIETNRGHFLGRVFWRGSTQADTGVPQGRSGRGADRVLRALTNGSFQPMVAIGDLVNTGEAIAEVDGQLITAPFRGVVRGLIHADLPVTRGLKVGDIDPREDPRYCTLVSEKSLAIGGGALEAILSRPEVRRKLWS